MKRTISVYLGAISFFLAFMVALILPGEAFAQSLGENTSFFVDDDYDFSGRSNVEAFLAYKSKNAYFYFEKDYFNSFSPSQKADIVDSIGVLGGKFDKTIYPAVRGVFGKEWNPGIDGDGRLVILFTRLQRNVGGYFNPNDEYPKDRVAKGRSNENEMIYLNPDFLGKGKVEGFLAHEFQHMIYWNNKTRIEGVVDDIWINEGRSELASSMTESALHMDFKDTTLAVRKKDFLINYTDSIIDWNSQNYDYSSAGMFMHYINDHFGSAIFGEMNSTDKTGIDNLNNALERDGGGSLGSVFTDWTITNYLNDENFDPRYGYRNKNLKNNFNINPGLAYDKNKDGIINITDQLKNWSANYYRINLNDQIGPLYIETDFDGEEAGLFSLSYVINYRNGSKGVGGVELNFGQDGKKDMSFAGDAVDSIVFIPSAQKFEGVDNDDKVKSFGFTLKVKVVAGEKKMRPDGSLIKLSGDDKVYLIEAGKRRWIADPAIFSSMQLSWANVAVVSAAEMSLYSPGKDIKNEINPAIGSLLVRGDGPQVYLIENNKRRWIVDAQTFILSGFDWNKVMKISEAELKKYEEGENISKSAFANGALIKGFTPQVYMLESGKKRWIVSAETFNRNHFNWLSVVQVSQETVNSFADGENIE